MSKYSVCESFLRIDAFVGGHLVHQLIAVARKGFERLAQHGRRRVSLGSLEEADAVVVRIMNQPRELLLPQLGLHISVLASGAEGQPGHLHPRFSKGYHVGGFGSRSMQRQSAGGGADRSNGDRGFEEFAA